MISKYIDFDSNEATGYLYDRRYRTERCSTEVMMSEPSSPKSALGVRSRINGYINYRIEYVAISIK